jgi:hypothetical protein
MTIIGPGGLRRVYHEGMHVSTGVGLGGLQRRGLDPVLIRVAAPSPSTLSIRKNQGAALSCPLMLVSRSPLVTTRAIHDGRRLLAGAGQVGLPLQVQEIQPHSQVGQLFLLPFLAKVQLFRCLVQHFHR